MPNDRVWGAMECGGTKFVCAIGRDDGALLAREVIPTTTPAETLGQAVAFFVSQQRMLGALSGVGIGSFGPLFLLPKTARYGQIGATPKPGWRYMDMVAAIEGPLRCPVALDTDVNCALLGEAKWGAGRGFEDLVYITVGTGIGAGVMVGGRVVYGFGHPEVGHMFVPKLAEDADFKGSCPFHQDRCVEGLASGPAMERRWHIRAEDLPATHPAWPLEARYLAQLCANLLMTTAPRRIILGGGVMQRPGLCVEVRRALEPILGGYLEFGERGVDIDALIVAPMLRGDAAIMGALGLAQAARSLPVD